MTKESKMKNLKFLIKEKLLTIVGQIYSDECKTFSQNESFQITQCSYSCSAASQN